MEGFQKFEELLSRSLVDAGVYLHLHPDHETVVRETARRLDLHALTRLSFVVSTVGMFAMKALSEEIRDRLETENDSRLQKGLSLLLGQICHSNDEVTAHLLNCQVRDLAA